MRGKRIPLDLTTRNNWNSEDLIKADKDIKQWNSVIAIFVIVADGAAKSVGDQSMKGSVYHERKFWTLPARQQGSELLFGSISNFVWFSIPGTWQSIRRSEMFAKLNNLFSLLSNEKQGQGKQDYVRCSVFSINSQSVPVQVTFTSILNSRVASFPPKNVIFKQDIPFYYVFVTSCTSISYNVVAPPSLCQYFQNLLLVNCCIQPRTPQRALGGRRSPISFFSPSNLPSSSLLPCLSLSLLPRPSLSCLL